MKDKKYLMLGTALVTLSSLVAASRAKGATGTVNMSAVIIEALTLNNTVNLDFGTMAPSSALAGTRSIDPDNTNNDTNVTSIAAGTAGQIQVNGEAARAFNVGAVAADSVSCTGGGTCTVAVDTMVVNNFRFIFADGAPGAGAGATSIAATNIPGDGDGVVYIGADLIVGANQDAGNYAGSFQVVIDYN